MIRIIVRTDDASMAANVGGAVHTEYRTFAVDLPEVEAFLRETAKFQYTQRQVTGIELVTPSSDESDL